MLCFPVKSHPNSPNSCSFRTSQIHPQQDSVPIPPHFPSPLLTPSFSYSYKLLRPQPVSFDIHTNCPGVGGGQSALPPMKRQPHLLSRPQLARLSRVLVLSPSQPSTYPV